MSSDYDSIIKNLYKSFDFELYQFCKNTIKKYNYLDLEELLLEIFNNNRGIGNFFDENILKDLSYFLSQEILKKNSIKDKTSKYVLNAFLKANQLAKEKNELVSTDLFLSSVLLTENKVSNYLKTLNFS